MTKPFFKNLIFLMVIFLTPVFSIRSSDRDSTSKVSSLTESTTYLPLISRSYPPPPPIFGTQVYPPGKTNQVIDLLEASRMSWVRLTAFNWKEIEPVRTDSGIYDWTKVREQALKSLSSRGMQVIAIVSNTPDWAQKEPPYECGPISEDALDEYVRFLQELVKRYGVPPYNIKYWELGNEPDIDPQLVNPDSVYGCWGDDDEYYGGGYYAEMLKVAYPAIKTIDPAAQILIGGLLLDCDPTNPPAGQTCQPAKFLEGVLRNGGGSFFDIVSFHGYTLYSFDKGGGLYNDEHHPGWESRGGVVLGKINFLREVMSNYGLNKPLMHTEGSLICANCETPGSEFYETQADYVVWLFVRNLAQDIRSTIWYQFNGPGWRFSGILNEAQEPKPAYDALEFITEELSDVAYNSPVVKYPSLRGYEFRNSQKRIWVLWSPDGISYTIDLPGRFQKVLDKYGADITPSGTSISVKSPIYIELGQ